MSTLKKRIERLEVELCALDQSPMVAVFFSDGRIIWNEKTYASGDQLDAALKTVTAERAFIIIKKRLIGQGALKTCNKGEARFLAPYKKTFRT